MLFSPHDKVYTLNTDIDDLADISYLAEAPTSECQRIEIEYIVLQRCRPFKTGLKEWN